MFPDDGHVPSLLNGENLEPMFFFLFFYVKWDLCRVGLCCTRLFPSDTLKTERARTAVSRSSVAVFFPVEDTVAPRPRSFGQ